MNRARAVAALAAVAVSSLAPTRAQHTLAGAVRDAAHDPVAGAEVTVRWRAHPELPGVVGWSLPDLGVARATARTDAAGRWRIDVPVAGPFEVVAASADRAQLSELAFPVMAGGFVDQALADAMVVGGIVREPEGRALADFPLTFEPDVQTWTRLAVYGLPLTRRSARTDGDGRFAVPWPNAYLRAPRWEPFLIGHSDEPTRVLRREEPVRTSLANTNLDLIADPTTPAAGTVRNAAGEPIAGAKVFTNAEPWRYVTTAADGSYTIPLAKRASLGAFAAGYCASTVPTANAKARREGAPTDFALLPAGTIRARLVDERGAALAGRDVLWSVQLGDWAPVERTMRSDAAGAVSFAASGPGRVVWGFVRDGALYRRFACVDGANDDVDLGSVVVAPRALRGLIVDADGAPLPDARIVVRTASPPNAPPAIECLWVTYSNHGGRFELPAAPPGPLVVMAECGARGFTSAEVGAAVADVRLAASRDGVAELDVLDEHGEPVAGVWVMLSIGSGLSRGLAPSPSPTSVSVIAFSDADGHVRVRGLPPGTWRGVANALRSGRLASGSAEVTTDGAPATVHLRPIRE